MDHSEIIEIKDDEINVEDIMRQIRENIKKRKESGVYTKDLEALINEPLQAPCENGNTGADDLQHNLKYINSNWDIHAEYGIHSYRPIIGRLLVWGRRYIHGEVRRYVDLMFGKQVEFNAHVVRTLNICVKDLDTKVNDAVAALNKDIDAKVNDAVAAVNKDIENKEWLANPLDKRIKKNLTKPLPSEQTDDIMNLFLFEKKILGCTEDIMHRQSIFLEYFKNCQNVLDIGCGRGEFLSLLKENGIGARGIDINDDIVAYCQKNGLDVQKTEALSYIRSLENESVDGVFSGQLVEHLQPVELIKLVKLCYDKMKSGTCFIAETVNPLCLGIFSTNFYIDLSHIKPVHPDTFKFLLESAGFREIQFKFFSPFPEEAKLKNIELHDLPDELKKEFEILNENTVKLNDMVYGYRDYAIIGRK